MADDGTMADGQNEEYKELRDEGMSKEEAADEAAPPDTTEERAEEADEEE